MDVAASPRACPPLPSPVADGEFPGREPPAAGAAASVNSLIERLGRSRRRLIAYGPGGRSEHPHAELQARVLQAAAVLCARLAPRSRVGLLAVNSVDFVVIELACIAAGLTTVCVDGSAELNPSTQAYFQALEVRAVIGPGDSVQRLNAELPCWTYAEILAPGAVPAAAAAWSWRADELLTIKQTSGSTGLPKAIGARLASIDDTLNVVQACFRHHADDRIFVFLPLYLLQQRAWFYASVLFGFDMVLSDLRVAFSALHASRPSVIMGVPKFYEVQKERIEHKARLSTPPGAEPAPESLRAAAEAVLGPCIRYLWTGSAPCSRETLAFFFRIGMPLFEGYGTNETDIISKNTFEACRIGSVGRVLPNRRVSFTAAGQICVWKRFPVSGGYEIGEAGSGGFQGVNTIVTSDLGYLDADGYLYVTGRVDDTLVLTSGTTINPREIELKLEADPAIRYAVVYGHNRPYLVAVIEAADPGVDREALERRISDATAGLGPSKRIARIVVAAEPFSEANGCLSAQFKLRRPAIFQRYREALAACYPT
jgi:long-subunit acyl-CoA synthetase (AMP-forming)